ncbi:SGNH hydrolase domain-containing protein [Macrococcus equi]|uniref:SGNH hydrolase domain-containing protein n=1 Tax=Macrococcus equi TaxID=3395462 RepID=UPI0039BE5319
MKKLLSVFFVILCFFIAFGELKVNAETLNLRTHPGVQVNKKTYTPYASLRPATKNAATDHNQGFKDGCHVGKNVGYAKKVCVYGKKTNYKTTLAIIGDSHSAHWLGAVQQFAEKYNIRVLFATKSGCTLSSTSRPDYPSCTTWNKRIIPRIAKYKPDVVLVKANNTQSGNKYDAGIIDKFRELHANNIKVFAIRDTPYFNVYIPDCVKEYGRNSAKCRIAKSSLPPKPQWVDTIRAEPYVKYVDYTNLICNIDKYCYPTQGNVILVRDRHHLTNSYSSTFSYYIYKDLYRFLIDAHAERVAKGVS